MAHGDAREGKWRGDWRMEWVASTLHTTSEHGISSITTADAHTSAASSRLNCRPPPSPDLNGLVRFAERRNLVSARVPSHFNWSLHIGSLSSSSSFAAAAVVVRPIFGPWPSRCWGLKAFEFHRAEADIQVYSWVRVLTKFVTNCTWRNKKAVGSDDDERRKYARISDIVW